MDSYKSLKINIRAIIKNMKCKDSFLIAMKLKRCVKKAAKKLSFKTRYVSD